MDQQAYKQRMFANMMTMGIWSVIGGVALFSGVGLFAAGVTGFAAVLGYSAAGIGLALALYQETRATIELQATTQDRQAQQTAERLTQMMGQDPARSVGRANGKSWADTLSEASQAQDIQR